MFRFLCLGWLTLLWPGLSVAPLAGDDLVGSRPNIVLVMTDDQGMGDLSCLGNPDLATPHLDRLHARSTRFTDFQVSPTCAPTRAALLSGRHPFRSGVTHTILERERMSLDATTVAQSLSDAGYATGIFGKWHLGDEDAYQPENRGFQESLIHGAGGIGQSYDCSCADAPPNRDDPYFDCVLKQNGRFVRTRGFCTDVFFTAALGWIRERSQAGQPFFAYVAPNAPHGPMIAPDSYKQPFLDAGFDGNTAGRYGMIVNIDDNMGRLMSRLENWQLLDNTVVIFMTDNGQARLRGQRHGEDVPLWTAGLRTGKNSVGAGGTTVPCFWHWRGRLEAGQDIDALAAHIDLFPTLADLAKAELPANGQVEGRSLLPLLTSPEAYWPDRYLFVHQGRWKKGANPDDFRYRNFAVRNARYRLVNNTELFDVHNDPGETTNLIADYPEVVAAMRDAYDLWWEETRPLLINENVPNAEQQPYRVNYERQQQDSGIPDWAVPPLD